MSKPPHHHPAGSTSSLLTAILRGKGAIAQGLQQAIAVATCGIYIGGDNAGIVNTGFQLTINNYLGSRSSGQARINKGALARTVHAYLEWLQRYCDGIASFTDPRPQTRTGQGQAGEMHLDQIFVPLNLVEVVEAGKTDPPRTASGAHLLSLTEGNVIVLLADAGQGKSLLLLNLARALATQLLVKRGWEDARELHKALGFSSFKQLAVPFYLPLNVFAEQLRAQNTGLKDYLDQHLPRESFDLPRDFFSTLIEHDHPVVLLLDGLDEVLDMHLRERVAEHLRNLSHGRRHVRFVIATRPSAYRGDARLAGDATQFTIAPFDDEMLDKVIRRLYVLICAGSGQDARKTRDLLAEIARLEDQRKAAGEKDRLIDSPLMAALAVQVREYTGQALPSRRADFLAKAVEAMLNAGYAHQADERRLLSEAVGGWQNHRRLLGLLAKARLLAGARNLTEPALRAVLKAEASEAHVQALIDFAHSRGGPLRKEADGRFWFVHLAIQQWLVAWCLAEQDLPADALAEFFLAEDRIADDRWREVVLLYAGLRREHANNPMGDTDRLAAFLKALAAHTDDATHSPAVRFACAEVAVRAAEENLSSTHEACAWLTAAAANALEDVAAMTTAADNLNGRLLLGHWLARHGDPREHVMTVDAMQFCLVPAGPFWMGDDASGYSDEQPQHLCDVPYDYWIGRYPVTNAQFHAFVQDEGYQNGAWWTVAEAAGAWAGGQVIGRVYTYRQLPPEIESRVMALRARGRLGEANRLIFANAQLELSEQRGSTPDSVRFASGDLSFAERVRHLPNHPVVGITWYEALAFCAWLQARWRAKGLLSEEEWVMLPSEAEWEKAARGGLDIPAPLGTGVDGWVIKRLPLADEGRREGVMRSPNPNPRRQYPWGDDFSTHACNVEDTGIGSTTAIGCFASGVLPYGCQELSGNAAEWTRSLYGPYDFDARRSTLEYPYPYTDRMPDRENLFASADVTRVVRGGSWHYDLDVARCAFRSRSPPASATGVKT